MHGYLNEQKLEQEFTSGRLLTKQSITCVLLSCRSCTAEIREHLQEKVTNREEHCYLLLLTLLGKLITTPQYGELLSPQLSREILAIGGKWPIQDHLVGSQWKLHCYWWINVSGGSTGKERACKSFWDWVWKALFVNLMYMDSPEFNTASRDLPHFPRGRGRGICYSKKGRSVAPHINQPWLHSAGRDGGSNQISFVNRGDEDDSKYSDLFLGILEVASLNSRNVDKIYLGYSQWVWTNGTERYQDMMSLFISTYLQHTLPCQTGILFSNVEWI